MKTLTCAALTLVASLVAAISAHAATTPDPTHTAAQHQAAVVEHQKLVAQARNAAATGVNAVQSTSGGPRVANPYRAYPPSCGASPLPDTPSGSTPLWGGNMSLYTRDGSGNPGTPETVTITLWRVACSSSGQTTPYNFDGGSNAMLLMRIDRSSTDQNVVPTMPLLSSGQQTTGGPASAYVRAAEEPNTWVSELPFDSPIFAPTSVFVLENYQDPADLGLTYFDYAFDLTIDPVFDDSCTGCLGVSIPSYDPDATTYPAAFQDVPIDGFESSAWYDPAHSGEGLMVQIYDNADNATRTLFAAWYTYDDAGVPFWLSIQGVASYGATSFSDTPVYYYTGGGFAGDFTGVMQHSWGTMNISFPDCRTMDFDFNGAASDVAGGPAGSGSREFQRLADINGLNCE